MTYCSLNGKLINASEASVSVADRGFRYGDGVFETISVVNGVPYQFEWHMGRLGKGLQALKIAYELGQLQAWSRELLEQNGLKDGFLRLQVTRGRGSRGYLPEGSPAPTTIIETMPVSEAMDDPVTLWKSPFAKPAANALPINIKHCNGLNSIMSRMEATEHGCFDALLLNEKQEVCETSSGNLFWCKGSSVFTPAVSCGLLEGSTRAALIRLAVIKEAVATIETLREADAVCITNVAWKCLAVSELFPLGIKWESEAMAKRFHGILDTDRKNYSTMHAQSWQ